MNWLLNFRPKMVMFTSPCVEDPTAITVQAVCAYRVFRVRYAMAIRKAENIKFAQKFLRG